MSAQKICSNCNKKPGFLDNYGPDDRPLCYDCNSLLAGKESSSSEKGDFSSENVENNKFPIGIKVIAVVGYPLNE